MLLYLDGTFETYWDGTFEIFLDLLNKLQTQLNCTAGSTFDDPLNPLKNHHHLASPGLFYRHYLKRYLSEVVEVIPFPHSCERSAQYLIKLKDFKIAVFQFYKGVYCDLFALYLFSYATDLQENLACTLPLFEMKQIIQFRK